MERLRWNILTGIIFLTSANISLQITASRYFSVTQSHHLAFFVVSTAFLGFGAAGCLLYLRTKPFQPPSTSALSGASFLFSLMIVLCIPALNSFPFEILELLWSKGKLLNLFFIHLILGLPFFFSGWAMASLTTIYAPFIRYLYAADLAGAAFGAFLPSLIFLPHGDRASFLIIGLVAATASLFLSSTLDRKMALPASALFMIILLAIIHPPEFFEFRLSPYKPLNQALMATGARPILTRWNSLARLDVVFSPSLKFAPGLSLIYPKALPEQLSLFIDGGQPSALTPFNHLQAPELAFLNYLPSALPFFLLKKPSVLIIEPRGGLEILLSLFFGARRIKIIENNPLILSVLKKDLAEKTGHLLSYPGIEAVASLPRSAIKREKEPYDLIIFSFPDIMAAAGSGLAPLQEDHLRTRESLTWLLHRLSPGGILMAVLPLLPPARQELRFLATIIEAAESVNLKPRESLAVILSWGTISFFIKNGPFSSEELDSIHSFCQERLFPLAYFPGRPGSENLESETKFAFPLELIDDLLDPIKRHKLYKQYLFNIRPASDNRPFFQQTIKFSRIKTTYQAFGKKWLPLIEGGGLYPILLFQATVIAFIFLLLPLLISGKKSMMTDEKKILPYFGLIGAGFMTVEILFIQKGILFLGHPTRAFSAALFSLLLSCGLGSLISSKWREKKIFSQGKFLLISALFILLDRFILTGFFDYFFSQPFFIRFCLFFLFILPTGFLLGFAFPAGISYLHRTASALIPFAWAINAFFSVITSILAIILAFWLGYSFLFLFSSFCYGLAFLFFRFANHGDKAHA